MTKTGAEWRAYNERVIAEFRAKRGRLRRTHPLILLTTVGAASGLPRTVPLNFSLDGDRIVVIASNAASPTHPAWYRNILANPEVTIEHGTETFRALAVTTQEPERTRLFDAQAAEMSFFDDYRRRVKAREIPVVAFERIRD